MNALKRTLCLLLTGALLLPAASAVHTHPGETAETPPFLTSPWAAAEVARACEAQIFLPDNFSGESPLSLGQPVTRNEFRAVAMQFLQAQEEVLLFPALADYYLAEKDETGRVIPVFRDKPEEEDRVTDRLNTTAYYLGLVEGRGNGVFDPDAWITREEAAAMLTRAYRVLDPEGLKALDQDPGFADWDEISPWARDSAAALRDWGVMEGTGDHIFSPRGYYTREQCVATFLRLAEKAPVSRAKGNVTRHFSYDQILGYLEDYYQGRLPDNQGPFQDQEISRWEGPTAVAIRHGRLGTPHNVTDTFFVSRDGRVRAFDVGLCVLCGQQTTGIEITDGSFSPEGDRFFCRAIMRQDSAFVDGVPSHPAGIYHITVDVQSLAVTQEREPLP